MAKKVVKKKNLQHLEKANNSNNKNKKTSNNIKRADRVDKDVGNRSRYDQSRQASFDLSY